MRIDWKPFAAGLFLLALAYLVYLPGLSGAFLFDDFGNLPPLGITAPLPMRGRRGRGLPRALRALWAGRFRWRVF